VSFAARPAAEALLRARRGETAFAPLPPHLAPPTLAEGVAVQVALAGLLGAHPPAGFKIGATALRMRAYLGLEEPLAGFMAAENLHPTGARLPFAAFHGVGVECEIAVRLARDLPAGPTTRAAAAAAVGAVFPAIEVVENRYGPAPAGDLPSFGVPSLLADQVYHAAAVLGAPVPDWQALDLASLPGRITLNGAEMGAGVGADLLGHPLDALAWLAGSPTIGGFGGLRAGQVVMLGSVTPPIWLSAPGTVTVEFAGLGAARLELA
jgi:2-keto-4-pentenoate hydratase